MQANNQNPLNVLKLKDAFVQILVNNKQLTVAVKSINEETEEIVLSDTDIFGNPIKNNTFKVSDFSFYAQSLIITLKKHKRKTMF